MKKVDELLRHAGYQPGMQFGKMCGFAASLVKSGVDEAHILEAVRQRFGAPVVLQTLRAQPAPLAVFGGEGIQSGAFDQMKTALRLPIAVAGALMPDGHPGYALPIGGVYQAEGAVSPSFVGYDIACRMAMSVYSLPPAELLARREQLLSDLVAETRFGKGAAFAAGEREHAVLEDPLWDSLPHLRALKDLAAEQLGSSGGGNHFADLMIGEVVEEVPWLPLPQGAVFTALLTHSGSRGAGHRLATHYVNLAQKETSAKARGIPKGYEWLGLDTEAGQEYWQVMELMGRYAQANHHLIHQHFSARAGLEMVAFHENHHNFAWRMPDGTVVHRKGATPAEQCQPGIIPGSSGTASYLVEGKGNAKALFSSPHGAGRPYSRSEAIRRHDQQAVEAHMASQDIMTVGLAPDESFLAYKDIEAVMAASSDLVTIVARMRPVAVVMGGTADDGD
jgi:tRNA-splicing ligase RtcB